MWSKQEKGALYIRVARTNDMDKLVGFNIEGLTLADFSQAYAILESLNLDWRTRHITDMTKAYMTGLERKIKELKAEEQEQVSSASIAPV